MIGQVLHDTYRIERQLGAGGMAAVYEASHLRLERRFAVKVLLESVARDRDSLARFAREAKITGSLGHANIVEVVDFHSGTDGRPYLVMELLRGEDLAARLLKPPRLTLDEIDAFCHQIASALDATHGRGIIHRDLKPSNLFICNGSVIKVLDFGMSKVLRSDSRLTRAEEIIGTPFYMAPEQIRGEGIIDARTDIYSMGAILFEMLTGQPPFTSSSVFDVLGQVLRQPAPPVSRLRRGLPADIDSVLHRALSKHATERPSSAGELARDFSQAAGTAGQQRRLGLVALSAPLPPSQETTIGPQLHPDAQQIPKRPPPLPGEKTLPPLLHAAEQPPMDPDKTRPHDLAASEPPSLPADLQGETLSLDLSEASVTDLPVDLQRKTPPLDLATREAPSVSQDLQDKTIPLDLAASEATSLDARTAAENIADEAKKTTRLPQVSLDTDELELVTGPQSPPSRNFTPTLDLGPPPVSSRTVTLVRVVAVVAVVGVGLAAGLFFGLNFSEPVSPAEPAPTKPPVLANAVSGGDARSEHDASAHRVDSGVSKDPAVARRRPGRRAPRVGHGAGGHGPPAERRKGIAMSADARPAVHTKRPGRTKLRRRPLRRHKVVTKRYPSPKLGKIDIIVRVQGKLHPLPIKIDGQRKQSPVQNLLLSVGRHRIEVDHPDYFSETGSIVVVGGKKKQKVFLPARKR